jgi:hypothetical protein
LVEFHCDDPTIPSACGPYFFWPCWGWAVAHLAISHRVS